MAEHDKPSDLHEIKLRLSNPRSPAQEQSWVEWWEPTPLFCVECGGQPVWVEGGDGDYYQGPYYFCLSCLCTFTYPSGRPFDGNLEYEKPVVRQRAELLRELVKGDTR